MERGSRRQRAGGEPTLKLRLAVALALALLSTAVVGGFRMLPLSRSLPGSSISPFSDASTAHSKGATGTATTTTAIASRLRSPRWSFGRWPTSALDIITQQDSRAANPSWTRLFGIPKLFRWLVDLYPDVMESVTEGIGNSDFKRVDNLYMDMNGIIHTCTHANSDRLVNLKESDMFERIFHYTDSLFRMVNPHRLLFLAIDGVAPRAKMNQQRARRFRSSKERELILRTHVAQQQVLSAGEMFDSNCITPGTQFMYNLGIEFRKWIRYKMRVDPRWRRGPKIIFSGPDIPGEGEHKIMDYIRNMQRNSAPDAQTLRHCMYGLDADLIMLSLVTHEPKFILIREKFKMDSGSKVSSKPQQVHGPSIKDFELLDVGTLRQLISKFITIRVGHRKLSLDRIRLIDDFTFICFLIGNDFLPSLPHLDIADGALNYMIEIYRKIYTEMGGFITKGNQIHLPRFELFIQELSRREALYFEQRAIDDDNPDFAARHYKEYYYKTKLGIEPGDREGVRRVVEAYVQGLVWVLTYYHEGCKSWQWFYPYLYAPLASDIIDLATIPLNFTTGRPFTPLLQLLSVLPPQSSKFLPECYQPLMSLDVPPRTDHRQPGFEVDPNGKKKEWESIVKIPFINETIMFQIISLIDHQRELSDAEKLRNKLGHEFDSESASALSRHEDYDY